MSNRRNTWSSISLCCAVTVTIGSISGAASKAFTSGAILIASGLVPKIVITFNIYSSSTESNKKRGALRPYIGYSFLESSSECSNAFANSLRSNEIVSSKSLRSIVGRGKGCPAASLCVITPKRRAT